MPDPWRIDDDELAKVAIGLTLARAREDNEAMAALWYGGQAAVDPRRLALLLMDLAWALAEELADAEDATRGPALVLRDYILALEETS
jgi:hypothetical protein